MTAKQPGHQHPEATGLVDYAGYSLLHFAVDRLGVSEAQLLRALRAQDKKAAAQRHDAEMKALRTRAEQLRTAQEQKATLESIKRDIDMSARLDRETRKRNAAIEKLEAALYAARGTTKDPGLAELHRWLPNDRRVISGQFSEKVTFYSKMAADAAKDAGEFYIDGVIGSVVTKGVFRGLRRLVMTRPFARLGGPILKLSKQAFKKLGGNPAAYPVPDYYHGTRFGKWQIARTGSTMEYRVTSRGRTLQIDGFAPSTVSPGKLDIVEAKFSNPDFDDITKSGHFTFWDSKEDQLRRLAQYAKDNNESVGVVRVVVNTPELGEIYLNLIEHLSEDLHPYLRTVVHL